VEILNTKKAKNYEKPVHGFCTFILAADAYVNGGAE
jgi:hypothetical protein